MNFDIPTKVCKYCNKKYDTTLGTHILIEHDFLVNILPHIQYELISDDDLQSRLKRIGLNF